MNPLGKLSLLLICTLGALVLSSCNIRLPIETAEIDPARLRSTVGSSAEPNKPDVTIWLMADTYHTNMAFPYEWLIDSGYLPPKNFGNPKYLVMSWGNSDAYSHEGLSTGKLLQILFSPTPSVLEVIPVYWHLPEVCPDQRLWTRQTPYEYGPTLANFINLCVETNDNGKPIIVRPSSWGDGVQLQSKYSYYIPRICNVWSAQAIESVGGKVNIMAGLTANGLIRQAEKSPNNFVQVWPKAESPE